MVRRSGVQCKQTQRRVCGLQCKIIDKDMGSANRNRESMWRHKGMNRKGGARSVCVRVCVCVGGKHTQCVQAFGCKQAQRWYMQEAIGVCSH